MAAGNLTVSITVPVTNAIDPNAVGRVIANTMLGIVAEQVGGNSATSGNLVYPPGSATVIGTWSFTAGT